MSLPRLFFPTVMLPDGRVIAVGGEYTGVATTPTDSNTGEIFDPLGGVGGVGAWTAINPVPSPSNLYGDVPMEVLSPTQVLAGDISTANTYLFNPPTTGSTGLGTWTSPSSTPPTLTKLGNDQSDEETWVKLPDGSILSYSIFSSMNANTFQAQRYIPASQTWINASTLNTSNPQSTPVLLSDGPTANPLEGAELGPAFLLPQNGQVIYFGANGNTAYYDPSSGVWTAGPAEPTRVINGTPTQLAATDDPGAVLPNGDILLSLAPLVTNPFQQGTPAFIYEYNPVAQIFTDVTPGITTAGGLKVNLGAFQLNMLVLPSGQVLMGNSGGAVQIYTESGASASQNSWRPTITSIAGNGTYTLTGTQLNGLDEGSTYGDDNETASNYPIVQLTSTSGSIYYARTSNWSSTGVATGNTPETVNFVLPFGMPVGSYTLAVIANGISSAGQSFTINPADVTGQVSISKSGLVYNRSTQLFGGTITITNTGTTNLIGTLNFEITGLPAGVTLANASGIAPDGNPYVSINLANGILAPGGSITFTVLFSDPTKVSIVYGFLVFDENTTS